MPVSGFSTFVFYLLVAVAGLFFVLLPLGIFFSSLLEKRSLRSLVPVGEESGVRLSPATLEVAEAAKAHWFRPMGVFTEGDPGLVKGLLTFLLADDGEVLLLFLDSKLHHRYKLISRFAGERWLVTSSIVGEPDLSGLEDEKMLPRADFVDLLRAHRRRCDGAGEGIVPFDGEHLINDFLRHDRARVGELVSLRLARYRDAAGESWSYTLRGSLSATWTGSFTSIRRRSL